MSQCPYPTVRFVAYEQRKPWGRIFVPDPMQRGRYILTHKCVAQVACPQCRSMVNEPCKGAAGSNYTSSTHVARQYAAARYKQEFPQDALERQCEDWEALA